MRKVFISILTLCFYIVHAQEGQPIETVIQKGHLQKIVCTAFHPSGDYIATGSADFSIKLWNVKTGKEIRSFNDHTNSIRSLEFSSDGSKLLTTSKDNYFKVFDVLTGKVIVSEQLKREDLWDAKFLTGDSQIMLSDGRDALYLYDLNEKMETGKYRKSYSSVATKKQVSPDGHFVAELVNYKLTRLVPLSEPFDTIDIAFDKAYMAEFSANGKYFALGSTKLFAKVFDTGTGKELHHLKDNEEKKCDGCNTKIAFGNQRDIIATGSRGTNLVIWNAANGRRLKRLGELKERPSFLSFSPDDKYLMVSDHKKMLVFDTKSGQLKLRVDTDLISYYEPKFSPDGSGILIPDEYNTCTLWDIASGKKRKTYRGYLNTPRTDQLKYSYSNWTDAGILNYIKNKTEVAISSDGVYFAQGKIDTIAQIVNLETGKVVHQLKGHRQQVIALAFSPDNKLLATGSGDRRIILWDVESGALIRTLRGHQNLLFDLKFNASGTELISSSWDGTIRTWEVATGKETGYKDLGNVSAYEVGFSPNDLYMVVADLDKNLNLIEADSREIFRSHIGHTKTVSGFDYTPDNTRVVSASWDGSVKVWDAQSGMLLSKFKKHNGAVLSVACHPSKKIAFSGGADRLIRIFNLETGAETGQLVGHNNSVSSLSISEKAGILVSCSIDGVVKVWDLETQHELYTYITVDRENWLVKNRTGYFDGTGDALKLINYVSGMESLSVSSFFKKYHAPGLQKRIMRGEEFDDTGQNIHQLIKSASEITTTFKDFQNHKITARSDSMYKCGAGHISLMISATNPQDVAKQVRIYNNGKLILDQPFEQDVNFRGGSKSERQFEIDLAPGENELEIVAINKNEIESAPQHFTLLFDQEAGKPDLFIMTIGINEYQNKNYQLNYARNDAASFLKTVKTGAKHIFHEVFSYALEDEHANKKEMDRVFREIIAKIGPEDVFVLYYAGHGVMSLQDNSHSSDFYLVTYDVTNLFGDAEMLKSKAVSATELMNYSRQVTAQKQLFILDACQSGGALSAFASRGAPREKALAQLARSTGTFFLTASQDAQYANEVGDLKHGIFTYAILEVLTGEVNEYSGDNRVTVNEIKSYVESRVPELSKQYHGTEQYPTSYSFGQDFPLAIFGK